MRTSKLLPKKCREEIRAEIENCEWAYKDTQKFKDGHVAWDLQFWKNRQEALKWVLNEEE